MKITDLIGGYKDTYVDTYVGLVVFMRDSRDQRILDKLKQLVADIEEANRDQPAD